MAIYRTITTNAVLSSDQIAVSSAVNGNISASTKLATDVQHSLVLDYDALLDKPQINSVELVGNKSLPEIGVDSISNIELQNLLN